MESWTRSRFGFPDQSNRCPRLCTHDLLDYIFVAPLKIHYHRGGIHLPELDLWLDPARRVTGQEKVFVSHAHSDHTGAHREVLLSAATAKLMRARVAGLRVERVLGFGEP